MPCSRRRSLLVALSVALAACAGGSGDPAPAPECAAPADCPGQDTECATRTCAAGACGVAYAAAGTALASQTAGDCQVVECDGAGGTRTVADDADVPADGNACTDDACTAGVPSNAFVVAGAACAQNGGTQCDGAGACVECLAASDCPGVDTECATRTCTAGACGVSYLAAGTPLASQTAGDCQALTCDGAGSVVSVPDDADVPVDGNACTSDACASGVPSNPPAAAGTACAQNGGTQCDGAGACVECVSGSDCASGVCLANACQAPRGAVAVSQVYPGGASALATYEYDFVELHNRSAQAVSVEGWSVQYQSASGSTWAAARLTGAIAPGGYYLVRMGSTFTAGALPLPVPDATGTSSLAAAGGKIALVAGTTPLAGCFTSPTTDLMDLVGYGTLVTPCAEGSPVPGTSATLAALRRGGGCLDTDDNAADFVVAAPAPRNSAAAPLVCGAAANETGAAAEADFCNVQFPATLALAAGETTPFVYGRLFEAGVTEAAGAPAGVLAEVGYGPAGTDPRQDAGWTFLAAAYNVQVGNDDEYLASFAAPAAGAWSYAYRFSLDGAATWTYCDLDGAGSAAGLTFDVSQLGAMTVAP